MPGSGVTIVTSMDEVLRQTAASTLLFDVPGAAVLSHDLTLFEAEGKLRRVVYDRTGVVEDTEVVLDHACMGCAVREDIVPTVARLAKSQRWQHIVLSLPIAAEPLPVVTGLATAVVDRQRVADNVRLQSIVATVDHRSLDDDLFGDDLLVERGLALSDNDRRGVGETLAHQIEFADHVVLAGTATPRATTVLRHLAHNGVRLENVHEVDGATLLESAPANRRISAAADPHRIEPTGAEDAHGVWTIDLQSWRPLHPDRLRQRIQDLGGGAHRSRGRFWLPTRPSTTCCWDGAGGQLSIGSVGPWQGNQPSTRLVVTGIDDPERVRTAFDDVLLTDAELAKGLAGWQGRDDGFDPWLGEADAAA